MTEMQAHHSRSDQGRPRPLNWLSVALFIMSILAVALVLLGVVRSGTSLAWVLLPLAFAAWNLLTLRR